MYEETPHGWQHRRGVRPLFYLEEAVEWRGEQNPQTTKRVRNDAAILTAPVAGVSSSSTLSVAAFVPPIPTTTPVMLAHRITLISALESSKVQSEKTWRRKKDWDVNCKRFRSTVSCHFMSRSQHAGVWQLSGGHKDSARDANRC